jgi:hypothetical protein
VLSVFVVFLVVFPGSHACWSCYSLGRYETPLQSVKRACNEFLLFFDFDLVSFILDNRKLERCVTTTDYQISIMSEDSKRKPS